MDETGDLSSDNQQNPQERSGEPHSQCSAEAAGAQLDQKLCRFSQIRSGRVSALVCLSVGPRNFFTPLASSTSWIPDLPHACRLQPRQKSRPLGRRRTTFVTLHSKEVWRILALAGLNARRRSAENLRMPDSRVHETRTLSGFIMQTKQDLF